MATQGITDAGAQPVPRLGARKRRLGEDAIKVALVACAFVSVATTIGIVIALLQPAIEFFREINFIDFITGTAGRRSSSLPISAFCRSSPERSP